MTSTKTKKFYTPKSDLMFKAVYINEYGDYHLLNQLLSECLGSEVKVIKLLDPELPARNKNEKSKRVDALIEIDGKKVNLELNGSNKESIRFRNLCYFNSFQSLSTSSGDDYDMETEYISIQLTFGMGKKKPLKFIYGIHDKINDVYYTKNYTIIELNMDKYADMWYSKDIKEPLLVTMAFDEKKMNEAVAKINNNGLKEVVDKVKRLNLDKEFVYHLTQEEDERKIHNTDIKLAQKEGLAKGESKRNIEIAKNMLEKGSDIEFISDVTGLSQKEVEKLNK